MVVKDQHMELPVTFNMSTISEQPVTQTLSGVSASGVSDLPAWLADFSRLTGVRDETPEQALETVLNATAEFETTCGGGRPVGRATVRSLANSIILTLVEWLSPRSREQDSNDKLEPRQSPFFLALAEGFSAVRTESGTVNLWNFARNIVSVCDEFTDEHFAPYTFDNVYHTSCHKDDYIQDWHIHYRERETPLARAHIKTLIKALRFFVDALFNDVFARSIRASRSECNEDGTEIRSGRAFNRAVWISEAGYRTPRGVKQLVNANLGYFAEHVMRWNNFFKDITPDLNEIQDVLDVVKGKAQEERYAFRKERHIEKTLASKQQLKNSVNKLGRKVISRPKTERTGETQKFKPSRAPSENPWMKRRETQTDVESSRPEASDAVSDAVLDEDEEAWQVAGKPKRDAVKVRIGGRLVTAVVDPESGELVVPEKKQRPQQQRRYQRY